MIPTLCNCGKRARKNGVSYDVNCRGEGPKICKVDGCIRVACKDGLCQNQQCTGKVRIRVRMLCKFPGCTGYAVASGKNVAGKPGEVDRV